MQVEQGLAKITHSRQQRRQRFGDVDAKATARFGKTCSPYQALSLLVSLICRGVCGGVGL